MKVFLGIFLFVASMYAETNPSLIDAWNSDGTFMDGTSGSFDPTGFQMTYMEDGTPIFTTLESQNSAPAHLDQGTRGMWFSLGTGANSYVYAMAVSGSDLYVGGNFTQAGGVSANYIARWNGSSWVALGSGLNGQVKAIAVSGSDVYVGGSFTDAGGNPNADYIARWNGSSWVALGSGLTGQVKAIAVSGSDVYVGGSCHVTGMPNTTGIVRWDGSSWHALGTGVSNYPVAAIAVSGSDVFIGGSFTSAGGVSNTAAIARWDGSTWHSLSSGIASGSAVYALCTSDTNLYAGGAFIDAGGNPNADYIARWDGSSWNAIGTGLESSVKAIANSGSSIYAGGSYVLNSEPIAYWDGSTWQILGSGLNGDANSIAVSGSDVYVGGDFTDAGGNPDADYIARWIQDTDIVTVTEPNASTTWTHGQMNVSIEWNYPSSKTSNGQVSNKDNSRFAFLNGQGGETVNILLYQGSNLVAMLAVSISNYGSWIYQGPIPEAWAPGQYRVYVEDDWGNSGWSDEFPIATFEGMASPEQQGSFIFPVSPNPSGGDVTIQYSLANPSDALVSIYDVSGRLVSTLASGEHSTGLHQAHVACLSSGVYICQLRVGSNSLSQSFVVIR